MSRYIWVAFGLLFVFSGFVAAHPLSAVTPDAADVVAFAVMPEQISPGQCVRIAWEVTGEAEASLWRKDPSGIEVVLSIGLRGDGNDCPPGQSGTVTYMIKSSLGVTYRYVTIISATNTPTLTPNPTATSTQSAEPTSTGWIEPPATSTAVPPTETPQPVPTVPPTATATPTTNYCPPQVIYPQATPAFWEVFPHPELDLPLVMQKRGCVETGEIVYATATPAAIHPEVSLGFVTTGNQVQAAGGTSDLCLNKVVSDVSAASTDVDICLTGSFPVMQACLNGDCVQSVGYLEHDSSPSALVGDMQIAPVEVSDATLVITEAFTTFVSGPVGSSQMISGFVAFPLESIRFTEPTTQTASVQASGVYAPMQEVPLPILWIKEFNNRFLFFRADAMTNPGRITSIPISPLNILWDENHVTYTTPAKCGWPEDQDIYIEPMAGLKVVDHGSIVYVMMGPVYFGANSMKFNECMWGINPKGPAHVFIDFMKFMRSPVEIHQKYLKQITSIGHPIAAVGVPLSSPGWHMPEITPPSQEEVWVFSALTAFAGGVGYYFMTGVQVSSGVVMNASSFILVPTEQLECWIMGGQEFCKVIDG